MCVSFTSGWDLPAGSTTRSRPTSGIKLSRSWAGLSLCGRVRKRGEENRDERRKQRKSNEGTGSGEGAGREAEPVRVEWRDRLEGKEASQDRDGRIGALLWSTACARRGSGTVWRRWVVGGRARGYVRDECEEVARRKGEVGAEGRANEREGGRDEGRRGEREETRIHAERRHEGHGGGTAQDGGSTSENIRVRREEIAWPGTLPPGSSKSGPGEDEGVIRKDAEKRASHAEWCETSPPGRAGEEKNMTTWVHLGVRRGCIGGRP
ncbi:hypothetical protein B0H14DRAFT_3138528 [Mycena olivaceomarginata]|nr:hypothetical protein B0H14DRAFT_3138528 [Mycena olivaceomarginata]